MRTSRWSSPLRKLKQPPQSGKKRGWLCFPCWRFALRLRFYGGGGRNFLRAQLHAVLARPEKKIHRCRLFSPSLVQAQIVPGLRVEQPGSNGLCFLRGQPNDPAFLRLRDRSKPEFNHGKQQFDFTFFASLGSSLFTFFFRLPPARPVRLFVPRLFPPLAPAPAQSPLPIPPAARDPQTCAPEGNYSALRRAKAGKKRTFIGVFGRRCCDSFYHTEPVRQKNGSLPRSIFRAPACNFFRFGLCSPQRQPQQKNYHDPRKNVSVSLFARSG